MREQEFDSSNYELASDYAFHLIQIKGLTETDALMEAAPMYDLTYKQLQDYWDQ